VNGPFVVVGGGIIGSAIAFELRERGVETILVERDIDPQGASAFSFASVSALDEPLRDVYLLKCMGMVGWRRWEKRLGHGMGLARDGEIRWAESDESARHLLSLIERAAGRGYPVRPISNPELSALLPARVPRKALAASFAPEDAQVDAVQAIDALRGAFLESDGDIAIGRANLLFEGASVRVRVGDVTIEPSRVVIAAGAETAALLDRFGWEIPMEPSPGLLVITEPTEHFVTGTVYAAPPSGPAIHLRQLSDGRVLVGERAQDYVTHDPTKRHAARLLHQARESFPALSSVKVDRFTVEWRPMPRDGMPIIGPLPGMPSVYVAAAHAGVTLAPVVGELVARELVDNLSAPRLEPFRVARFTEHRADAYLSIEEAFATRSEMFLG
jgi:glycine/D-amino acid oxidase-like deaminating enzyme